LQNSVTVTSIELTLSRKRYKKSKIYFEWFSVTYRHVKTILGISVSRLSEAVKSPAYITSGSTNCFAAVIYSTLTVKKIMFAMMLAASINQHYTLQPAEE